MESGSFSFPDFDDVASDVGDKVLDALRSAVDAARADLALYRSEHPDWVASHSVRGLANWLHDRVWAHLLAEVDGLGHVEVADDDVTRELRIPPNYRARIKRHHPDGRVSSYPTQTVLDFYVQGSGQLVLAGLEELRLLFGYMWDADANDLGGPVISLRDGEDDVVWMHELDDGDGIQGADPIRPPLDGPTLPTVETKPQDEERSADR